MYSIKQLTTLLNNLQQTHIDEKQLQSLLTSSIDIERTKIVAASIQEHLKRVDTYKEILKQFYKVSNDYYLIFNEILPVVSFNRRFGHTSGIVKWTTDNPNLRKGIIVQSIFQKNELNTLLRDAGAQNFKIFINCDAIRGINLDVIVVENPSAFDNTRKIKILEYCNTLGIVPIAVGAGGWSYKE